MQRTVVALVGAGRLVGVAVAVLAVACGSRARTPGNASLVVQVRAPADVTRVALEVQPANVVRELSAADYDGTTGAFATILTVPAGDRIITASGYAGPTLLGTTSAAATFTAGATATVHLTIVDPRPPTPGHDRAPIITSFVVPVATLAVGASTTVSASATDLDGDPVAFAWTASPGWCGAFTERTAPTSAFVAAGVGACTLTFTASANGQSDTESCTIGVTAPTYTIAGTLTYDRVPPSASGLDYAATVAMPIRGAVVELLDGSTPVATTTSDDAGAYSLSWTGANPIRVRVKALTSAPAIRVEDNTNGDALYAMISPAVDGATTTSLNLHAPSGWTGTSYTRPRVAAPFAILDDAYSAARTFLAERAVVFPDLRINWSVNNRPESGSRALGQIGTTHWDGSEVYVLGLADADTDEFDSHVVLHEWAHYLVSRLSRSDSPGGPHDFGDLEDPRLSWREGWATALGAIVLYPDDVYADTSGPRQQTTEYYVSAEDNDDTDPNPGWFSEASVMHVAYDLWDPATDAEPFDTVSFGVGALYDVMAGFQKDTDAFTTVFSFVTGLLDADPSSSRAIDVLLAHRGVAAPIRDEFGLGETHDGGVAGALPVYNALAVGGPAITVTFTPDPILFNHLGQNRFAVFAGTGASVTLSASNANHDPFLVVLYEKGVERRRAGGCGPYAGPARIAGFPSTAGAVYTGVIAGCDTVGPGTRTATVTLTSP